MASPPRRPGGRRPIGRPSPDDQTVLPSFLELLALLAPFGGALVGWWLGLQLGGIWFGLVGGLVGTGVGAVIARRGASSILP
ncbi:MAG: hypothetical protein KA180_01535 [Gemmatimonadales bacterium]|nr:hypothetical protein [Gemmatimonadota bacterium]MBK7348421.1 hypothetical protein [Gemmatimonadota bacterium]MBK7783046.1 hypothetical protein [Gemmatimonadota bacterium]MBP6668099.1 hypothetical protein [Gemmatimonadales bacterium]MBP9199865.1 hypothetical protein [Gemmatimonadales bacterium]